MNYPNHNDSEQVWIEWVNRVAPLRGPVASDLHQDLQYLCGIADRELAAISAKGVVTTLRERRLLDR